MLLEKGIGDYLLYLQHEQGAAVNTIRSYRPSLRRFQCWVEAQGLPAPTIGDTITPLYAPGTGQDSFRPPQRGCCLMHYGTDFRGAGAWCVQACERELP